MVTTPDPLAAFPERPTPAMNFNWRALAGLASGNNVGEQFANVNSLMAQQEATQHERAQEAQNRIKEQAQKSATYNELLKIDPEKATLFKAGVIDGATAFKTIVDERKAKQDAAKPDYMAVKGLIFDKNSGKWMSPPADMAAADNPPEYGLTPQTGVDKDGNPVLIQISKDGRSIQTPLPEGVSLSKTPIKLDAGTHFIMLDPVTRQQVGIIPKDIAGEEQQKVEGKLTGEALQALPKAITKADQAISVIDQALNHPGREKTTGWNSTFDPRTYLPGTDSADFQAVSRQLEGKAFLEAFESLKGGGQITQVEGDKATQAIARLSTAQSDEAYKQSLLELRQIVEAGKRRAQAMLSAGRTDIPADQQPATNSGVTSSGLKFTVDP